MYLEGESHFASACIAPKIEACVGFLEGGGREALITDPTTEEAMAGDPS